MLIQRSLYDQMIAHCQKGYPFEACGILVGKGGKIQKIYCTRNVDHSAVSYSIDSKELLQISKELRIQRLEMLGIFHSHVASEAYPSSVDKSLAFYPDATYVIISLANRTKPITKGYRIIEEKIIPEELEIV